MTKGRDMTDTALKIKIVGYWNNAENKFPMFPTPVAREKPWKGKRDFVAALTQLEEMIGEKLVGRTVVKGANKCLMCGEVKGGTEYQYNEWRWPESLLHYVQLHNVKPDQEFIDYIMAEHAVGYDDKEVAVPKTEPGAFKKVVTSLMDDEAKPATRPTLTLVKQKPHIQELFDAHSKFNAAQLAASAYIWTVRAEKFEQARKEYREALEKLGVAHLFDWTDK